MEQLPLQDFIDTYRREVNAALTEHASNWYAVTALQDAVRYALWGGKRLRPLLALMSAHAVDGAADLSRFVRMVCALEMVHIFTLVHDDLPAMDDAKFRHGQACTHIKYGEGVAILAGDALLNQAIAVALTAPPRDLDAARRIAIARHIARACATVVEGQVIDLSFEGVDISLDDLENLHRCKTAAFLEACCLVGAELAGADDAQRGALADYAHSLGLAYQIKDDLLSVTGDEAEVGKTLSSDADADKATYPKLLGVERSVELLHDYTERAIAAATTRFGDAAALLVDFARYQRDRTR